MLVALMQDAKISARWVYGGSYTTASVDNDLHILSLPAFQWFKAQTPSPDQRTHHTCHPAGNNQMVIIGGYDKIPDPWASSINVYDMSALQWKDRYEADADPYKPPNVVSQYYSSYVLYAIIHLAYLQ